MVRLSTLCIGALVSSVACSPANDPTQRLSPGRAGLAVELVDAPTQRVREINVTIEKVTAHSSAAGWVTIFDQGPVTVDLLTLQTRVMQLGFSNLPQGKITQIRLYLTEGGPQNVVLPGGTISPLKVPSGVQSGIKIKGPFELSSCDVTTVTLDFDGHKSIWYHPTGNGGDWILRPVIHTKKVRSASAPCDGTPTGGGGGEIIEVGGGGGAAPGVACTVGTQCLSGVCNSGLCSTGAQGTPCNVGSNCVSGICGGDGSCTAPIGAPPLSGNGSACAVGSQCVSGVCAAGLCSGGLQGQPCNATADCDTGFVCAAGACEPALN